MRETRKYGWKFRRTLVFLGGIVPPVGGCIQKPISNFHGSPRAAHEKMPKIGVLLLLA